MGDVYMKSHLLQLDTSSLKPCLVWGDKKTENIKRVNMRMILDSIDVLVFVVILVEFDKY